MSAVLPTPEAPSSEALAPSPPPDPERVAATGHSLAREAEALTVSFDRWSRAPLTHAEYAMGVAPFPDPTTARAVLTEAEALLVEAGNDLMFEMRCATHSLRAHADDLRAILERVAPFLPTQSPRPGDCPP